LVAGDLSIVSARLCLKVLAIRDRCHIAAHRLRRLWEHIKGGPTAANWITFAMVISALGSMNSSVNSGEHVLGYAMASRTESFSKIVWWHPSENSARPDASLIFQGRSGKF